MKKCFTINAMRKPVDFLGYDKIITDGIFCGVELFFPYNVSDEQKVIYQDEVTKLLSKHQMEVVLHLPHGGENDLITCDYKRNEKIIERMKDAIVFASLFKARKLTLHLGSAYLDKNVSRDKLIDKLIDVLKELCDYASKYKMALMIENMPREKELGYSPKEILDIIKRVDKPNLKFIYDTGHAHVSSYDDLEYIDLLKDYLYHIHFSDNHGISDEHKPIGEGTIDFKSLFKKLNEIKYPELHCLEIIFKDYNDLVDYAGRIEKYNYLYE